MSRFNNIDYVNFEEKLGEIFKDGVDIYWENVGGKTFNAV